jgi:hypothetical protein
MWTVLQDVEFNDQQHFNQFVAQSKSHMEVGCVPYVSTFCVSLCHKTDTSRIVHISGRYESSPHWPLCSLVASQSVFFFSFQIHEEVGWQPSKRGLSQSWLQVSLAKHGDMGPFSPKKSPCIPFATPFFFGSKMWNFASQYKNLLVPIESRSQPNGLSWCYFQIVTRFLVPVDVTCLQQRALLM